MISGNMVGSYSQLGKTFLITDENGNELTGVVVDQETLFTAGDNDVREGKVYASDIGVSTGTKIIPAYHTSEGYRLIPSGGEFKLINLADLNRYDFTKLQAIICSWGGNVTKSVAADRVVIDNNVYLVNSSEVIAPVVTDDENKTINLGIINTSDNYSVLRYFTYKEIY